MKVAIVLYEDFTALDAIGPYEVMSRVPGWEITFVAAVPGPQNTDAGVTSLEARASFDEITEPDIVLVPGGPGSRFAMEHEPTLEWLRRVSPGARWVTSVCTGSLILAAAGLLNGRRATTHWTNLERLRELGAEPVAERVVIDGNVVTAAGVSSGIDMALTLVAEATSPELAEAMQLAIEYDPQPPFDSGSPRTAAAGIVDVVTQVAAQRDPWLAERLER
ncbi:MAG TPA: DJ-1/PfpI family protein [Solirubrobacterales bacterium]|nr:DJ-1/PfpI family protein [Solirubrobacterales bacterium]